nr:nucleotide-binding alpha-beta plait domain-containing protein [Tanacetum cinerariifolium]
MGSYRSKEDDIQKISTSVFVTNFPDEFSAKDLWNTCKKYGYVVDAYIPHRRTKTGKRFGFVRFIRVFDVALLVNNLCTVWVGSYKLHANIPKFNREPLNKQKSFQKDTVGNKNTTGVKRNENGGIGMSNSYASIVKEFNVGNERNYIPTLVLNDYCLNKKDYSLCLISKVKDFVSLANLKVVLGNEGFNNIKLSYMGGYWVMVSFPSVETMKNFQSNVRVESWFSQIQTVSHDFVIDGRVTWVEIEGLPFKMWTENTFSRVASKWGSLLDMDDKEDVCYHSKRICINTNVASNIFESFKVNYKGKTIWVRAKEVPGWVPDFVDENDVDSDTDKESKDELPDVGVSKPVEEAEEDSDEEVVPNTKFDEIPTNQFDEEVSVGKINLNQTTRFTPSVDKANNGEQLLDGNENTNEKCAQEDERTGEKHTDLNQKSDIEESVCSGHFKKSEFPQSGGSILLLIEELVKVGQAMGYNMEGCSKNMEQIIELQGDNE